MAQTKHQVSEKALEEPIFLEFCERDENSSQNDKFIRLFPEKEALTLLLDCEAIEHMDSGTCIIPSNQAEGNRVVVCKEGKSLKIFRIT